MEYALVRSRPAARRTRWSFTSANSAWGTTSVRDVRLRPEMVIVTLCIRRYESGGSEYRARTRGGAAVCHAQGLKHPGMRDPRRSQGYRKGITHCKHGGNGVGDKFCTPIQGELRMLGLRRELPDILTGQP